MVVRVRRRRRLRAALIVVTVSALASVAAVTASAQPDAPTIRYTEYGIPHIVASDYEGIGEGYGYAVAKDNICVLADMYLTVDARRSRHHGPDGAAEAGYASSTTNLNSDLFFQRLKDDRTVEKLIDQPPPNGPDPEVEQTIHGYVEGFNRYLAETGVDNITDPACKGAEWVRPITEVDVYRHVHALVLMGSIDYVLDGVVEAAPAAVPADSPAARPPHDVAERIADALNANHEKGIGSNALAVGSDGTTDGRSMLLGNPHFPWLGKNRFYQAHITIPGELDVSGASLLGLPGVMIGHNADVAWSHTVATVAPFGLFEVQVDPLRPTKYLVDGKWEDMTSQQVSVDVRQADGTIGKRTRTLWSTRYGPITTSLRGSIPLPWVVSAHAVREANMNNLRALNTWSRLARTGDTNEVVDVLEETQGVPFLNTIASDRKGDALYADIQVVPNISDAHADACLTETGKLLFGGGLTLTPLSILDGKRSACDWPDDPDAAAPGLLDPAKQPRLIRSDYVGNANDSPWLANPDQPLSYPRVMGDAGTARTTRTQELIVATEKRLDGTDGLPGKGFSPGSMRKLLFLGPQPHGRARDRRDGTDVRGVRRRDGAAQRWADRRQRGVPGARGLGSYVLARQSRIPAVPEVLGLDRDARPRKRPDPRAVEGRVRPGGSGAHAQPARDRPAGRVAGVRQRGRRAPGREHPAGRAAVRAPGRDPER